MYMIFVLFGISTFIPNNAQKPTDKRGHRNTILPTISTIHKPLPIGVSDYREACSNYYYVDKTLLINEFLDERPKVSLFTRPRRFGKTLNMDMLRVFLKKQKKILLDILETKKYGLVVNHIACIKVSTP